MKTPNATNSTPKKTINWKTVLIVAETAVITIVASIAFGFYLGMTHAENEKTATQEAALTYAKQLVTVQSSKQ